MPTTMALATAPVTAEALLDMGDVGPCELIGGEVREMTPAGAQHGHIVSSISLLLGDFVRSQQLGTLFGAETGVILKRDPDTVRAPDAMFVNRYRLSPDEIPEGFLEVTPDLVVEVVSPRDTWTQIQTKVGEYVEFGVPVVWIIDGRNRQVHVYEGSEHVVVLSNDDSLDGGDVLPGFACKVSDIFN